MALRRIVSGGQTGVDRAALDVALDLGVECGGWCPRGRLAEDGAISDRYPLSETTSSQYHVRTKKNVSDSNATLILNVGPLEGGTALTSELASEHGRPCIVVDLDLAVDVDLLLNWLKENDISVLNIAGPRASKRPDIYRKAYAFLQNFILLATESHPS